MAKFEFDINIDKIVQGNNGTVFDFTVRDKGVAIPIDGATVEVAIRRAGEMYTKQAEITDAPNGKCQLILTLADLTVAGQYYFQPTVYFVDGSIYSDDSQKFKVSGKLTGNPPTDGGVEIFSNVKDSEINGNIRVSGAEMVVYNDEAIWQAIAILERFGISASGNLVIDGIEQTGGSEEMTLVVRDYFEGSANITKTYEGSMIGFEIVNDGTTTGLTFTINNLTIPVKAGESYAGNFEPYNQVDITTAVPYRATVLSPLSGTVTPAPVPADETAPIVTVTPNGGTFNTSQGVTLSANETATIYYTLDGSTPTEASTQYSGSITVTETATLKYFAKDTVGNASTVQSVTFTKDAGAPADTTPPTVTASPVGGTFTSVQNVTLTTEAGAAIYYTVDGSTPTVSSSVYSAPIPVNATTTLKYFGKDEAGNSSTVQTATYTINLPDVTAPSPISGLTAGTTTADSIPVSWVLSASGDVANQEVAYSTDGTNYTVASGAINPSSTSYSITGLNASTLYTVRAVAIDGANNRSTPVTVQATTVAVADITDPIVTASPVAGTYTSTQSVTLTADEPATIYYTTDGTEPTEASTVYNLAISISATTTLKYFAKDTAGNASTVITLNYTINDNSLVFASFDGANSATSIPTTETGQTWTALAGTWGINSNKAYLASGSNAIAVVDAGVTDADISADITWGSEGTLVLRAKDATNLLFLRLKSNQVQFYEMANGSATMTYSYNTAPLVVGQVYNLRAEMRGATITCYLDGVKVLEAYSVLYMDYTKFGFRQSVVTSDRYDNFAINQLPNITLADYVAYDSFDRADSATSLGTTETGQVWEQLVDTWGIKSKTAYVSQDSNVVSSSHAVAVVNTGLSNAIIESVCTVSDVITTGITFRATDSGSHWYFKCSGTEVALLKFTGGAYTKVTFLTESHLATQKLKVVLNGSNIECFVNGVSKLTFTDVFNQTATKHGISGLINTDVTRFDNFSVKALV